MLIHPSGILLYRKGVQYSMEINCERIKICVIELGKECSHISLVITELENLDRMIMRQEIFDNIHIKMKREIDNLYNQLNCLKKCMFALNKIIYIYKNNEQRVIDSYYWQKGELRISNYYLEDLTYLDKFISELNIM